jgi:hypothetical protein
MKSWMRIRNKGKHFKQIDQGKGKKMITLKKIALNITLIGFLLGGSLCFAASNEIGRDGTYVAYDNGIVRDTSTGLEWVAGPDKDTTWEEAKLWVGGLNTGKGWRMPKMGELEDLHKEGSGERNMTPLLKTNGWWVWSEDFKETTSHSMAWNFNFFHGTGRWNFSEDSTDRRAFAVRSLKDKKR